MMAWWPMDRRDTLAANACVAVASICRMSSSTCRILSQCTAPLSSQML